MSDDVKRPDDPAPVDPPGPLGLAARLRRETPVEASLVIPDPALAGEDEDDDAPAARVPLRERLRAEERGVELLLFRVGGDLFATDLLAVQEAVAMSDVHPVPGAPPAMLGVLGLRGRLVPVYSPERALAQPPHRHGGDSYLLVLRAAEEGARPVAIVVDDVEDVHAADLATVQDLADAGGADDVSAEHLRVVAAAARGFGDVVLGVLHWNGRLVALVDTDALVAACAADAEQASHAPATPPTRALPGRETS